MRTRTTKGSSVRVEVFRKPPVVSMSGAYEVWVRVLSTEMLDWPRVEAKLDMRAAMDIENKRLLQYLPHMVTPAERLDHGFHYEDWWVFA